MIAKLSVPFNSRAYENPSLQKHYSNLQAVALDRGDDEVEDGVLPDLKGMKKHAATLLAFKEAVLPDGYNPDPKKTPAKTKKRPRGDDDEDLEVRSIHNLLHPNHRSLHPRSLASQLRQRLPHLEYLTIGMPWLRAGA